MKYIILLIIAMIGWSFIKKFFKKSFHSSHSSHSHHSHHGVGDLFEDDNGGDDGGDWGDSGGDD